MNTTEPFRILRSVLKLSVKEMALYFHVSTSYINNVEFGRKQMDDTTLKSGLERLNIPYEKYEELVKFKEFVSKLNLGHIEEYTLLMTKAMAIVNPSLTKQSEAILDSYYEKFNIKI